MVGQSLAKAIKVMVNGRGGLGVNGVAVNFAVTSGAAILSVAMMLDHLGHALGAERIRGAVRQGLLSPSPRTPDLLGNATTTEVGRAVRDALLSSG